MAPGGFILPFSFHTCAGAHLAYQVSPSARAGEHVCVTNTFFFLFVFHPTCRLYSGFNTQHTPACLNCAGIKYQPLQASCVTSTSVLAKSLVPLRGRGGQPNPDPAWSWISPVTAGSKLVSKAAHFPVSAESSTAS